jgi:hypothetical protein
MFLAVLFGAPHLIASGCFVALGSRSRVRGSLRRKSRHAYLESLTGKGVSFQLDNPAILPIAERAGSFRVPASLPDFLRLLLGNLGALFWAVPGDAAVKNPRAFRKPVHSDQLRRDAAIRRIGRPAVPGIQHPRRIWPEQKPCKRFRKMRITARFLAHLKNCLQCCSVIRHLCRELEIQLYLWRCRN